MTPFASVDPLADTNTRTVIFVAVPLVAGDAEDTVFESTDAVDMTVDNLALALLHGETDTSGYPDYNAIVGGLASHWDELSGDLIVRAVVGWGGRGQRGDTERHGNRLLSSLYQQVRATGHSLGAATSARARLSTLSPR